MRLCPCKDNSLSRKENTIEKYWFTVDDPRVDKNHHGVWVRTNKKNEAREAAERMRNGNLVFIYELKDDRDFIRHDGRQEVVALVKVEDMPFSSEESDWIKVANTKWLAPISCSADIAAQVTRIGSLGGVTFLHFGVKGFNCREMSSA